MQRAEQVYRSDNKWEAYLSGSGTSNVVEEIPTYYEVRGKVMKGQALKIPDE
jgi:hypothetical protein